MLNNRGTEAHPASCLEYEMAGMGPQARPCIIVKECAGIRDGWNGMLGDACLHRERALAFSGPARALPVLIRPELSLTEAVLTEK